MSLSKNRFYSFLFAACVLGYIWIFLQYIPSFAQSASAEVCLIRKLSGIPCPSCGSTRSILALLNGNPAQAWAFNPLGFLLLLILLISPIWIIADVLMKSESLHRFYLRVEKLLQNRMVAVPMVVLILLNWLWNISKGL